MGRQAARVLDPTIHPLPGTLLPGPGSPNVIIGGKLAWRGLPAAAAAGIQAAKQTSDAAITAAETATKAAAGTPGAPAALAAEQLVKTTALTAMSSAMNAAAAGAMTLSGGMPDKHICATPLPIPPHGPGMVIDGSQTVLINGLPACRMQDTVLEALGPPDKIAMGMPTVYIGDSGPPAVPVPNQAVYDTPEDAARAAISLANPQSVAANSEFGGMIFKGANGKYGFTGPGGGTGASFSPSSTPIPAGTTAAGDYHTHGDYSTQDAAGNPVRTSNPANDQFGSDDFSGPDRRGIRNDAARNPPGYKGYLGTPSGHSKQFDPATGQTTAL